MIMLITFLTLALNSPLPECTSDETLNLYEGFQNACPEETYAGQLGSGFFAAHQIGKGESRWETGTWLLRE